MTNEHGAARAWSSGFSLASAATKEPTAEAQDVRKIVAPASRRHGGWTTPFASTSTFAGWKPALHFSHDRAEKMAREKFVPARQEFQASYYVWTTLERFGRPGS